MTDEAPLADAKSGGAKGRKGGKKKGKGAGRPKSDNPKVQLTIRLDNEVVEAFKADGPGWQSRINKALKQTIVRRQRRAERKASAGVEE